MGKVPLKLIPCACVCVCHKAQSHSIEISSGLSASCVVGGWSRGKLCLGAELTGTTPGLHPYSGQVISAFPHHKYCLTSSSATGLWDKREWI